VLICKTLDFSYSVSQQDMEASGSKGSKEIIEQSLNEKS
jgi:hypothetical protein